MNISERITNAINILPHYQKKSSWKKLFLSRKKKTPFKKKAVIFLNKLAHLGRTFKFHTLRKNLISFDKRERFALQTIVLTAGLIVTQLIWEDIRFLMVFVLSVSSYILSIWSLKEDINGVEWLFLFILPVSFTASLSLFYFLLPERWIFRLSLSVVFALGTYAILLVENIYNVAAQRSIQLLRAAQSVGLLLTLAVIFLASNIIYSLRFYYYLNAILLFFVALIMSMQSVWSINLESRIHRNLVIYPLVIGLGIFLTSFALSFWPLQTSSYSLCISATYYCLTGIFQQHILQKLFGKTIREYAFVFILSIFIVIISTRWG